MDLCDLQFLRHPCKLLDWVTPCAWRHPGLDHGVPDCAAARAAFRARSIRARGAQHGPWRSWGQHGQGSDARAGRITGQTTHPWPPIVCRAGEASSAGRGGWEGWREEGREPDRGRDEGREEGREGRMGWMQRGGPRRDRRREGGRESAGKREGGGQGSRRAGEAVSVKPTRGGRQAARRGGMQVARRGGRQAARGGAGSEEGTRGRHQRASRQRANSGRGRWLCLLRRTRKSVR